MSGVEEAEMLAKVFTMGASLPPKAEECPRADELWAAVSRELEYPQRLRVLDHCARCPSCAQDLACTRELWAQSQMAEQSLGEPQPRLRLSLVEQGEAEPEASPQPPTTRADEKLRSLCEHRARRKGRLWAGGLGTLAVAALALLYLRRAEPENPSQGAAVRYRGESQDIGARSERARDSYRFRGGEFRWPADRRAKSYQVVIVDDRFQSVCTSRPVHTNRLRLVDGECSEARLDEAFYWRVRSTLQDGTLRDSPVHFVNPAS